MPTYEYACKTCGHVFEHVQPISARPLRTSRCGACGKTRPVQRLISGGAALIFKGGGFYQTDYRSESYKQAAKADSGHAAAQPGDSKPAADGAPSGDAAKPNDAAKPGGITPSDAGQAAKSTGGTADASPGAAAPQKSARAESGSHSAKQSASVRKPPKSVRR